MTIRARHLGLALALTVPTITSSNALAADLYTPSCPPTSPTCDLYPSLQAAVDASQPGDTIYTRESFASSGIITIPHELTISGSPGAAAPVPPIVSDAELTLRDLALPCPQADRPSVSTVSDLHIERITLTNCSGAYADSTPAILVDGGSLSLADSEFLRLGESPEHVVVEVVNASAVTMSDLTIENVGTFLLSRHHDDLVIQADHIGLRRAVSFVTTSTRVTEIYIPEGRLDVRVNNLESVLSGGVMTQFVRRLESTDRYEYGNAVLFLVADEINFEINQSLFMDGGWPILAMGDRMWGAAKVTDTTFIRNVSNSSSVTVSGTTMTSLIRTYFCENSGAVASDVYAQWTPLAIANSVFAGGSKSYDASYGFLSIYSGTQDASIQTAGNETDLIINNSQFHSTQTAMIYSPNTTVTLNAVLLDSPSTAVTGSGNKLAASNSVRTGSASWSSGGVLPILTEVTTQDEPSVVQPWPTGSCEELRHWLSPVSPLRDQGSESDLRKDRDGSRNDIGAFGGPDSALRDDDGDQSYFDLDCDDTNSAIHPMAGEVPYDDIDQDCTGSDLTDQDLDGFPAIQANGTDCNDLDPQAHPGAEELWYSGQDEACNGGNDFDQDQDGHVRDVDGGDDCNDQDALVYGTQVEVWYNGKDENCDGNDLDRDEDGHLVPFDAFGAAVPGGDDCNDLDAAVHPGGPESWYNGEDENCDDNDGDQDFDGFLAIGVGGTDCDDVDATVHPAGVESWYDGIDSNCDGADDFDQDGDGDRPSTFGGEDCDDADPERSSMATEAWYDGVDQDCDGNDLDQDGDGYLTPFDADGQPVPDGNDCNDLVADRNPGAVEVWYDGVDQDCQGDDFDQDSDGHTSADHGGDDCDDTNALVYPGATETMDELDRDCDGWPDPSGEVTPITCEGRGCSSVGQQGQSIGLLLLSLGLARRRGGVKSSA